MASLSTTKTVVLDEPSDWELWLFVIKTIADRGDTWPYIDPDLPEEPAVPTRPVMPKITDINLQKNTLSQLDTTEKEMLKLSLAMYKEDLINTNKILDTIQSVCKHIITTISTRNIIYINDKTTVYQMLVALKKRLAPMDYA